MKDRAGFFIWRICAEEQDGGQQIEETGECVFQFGDPGDGFDLNGVEREEDGSEPGAWD